MNNPTNPDFQLFTLSNSKGMKMTVTNYGGRIVSLYAPDKNDKFEDVVLGYDSLQDYTLDSSYFGALIGRYSNRIARGKFTLDNKDYHVPINNGINSLHGGLKGFHFVFWHVEEKKVNGNNALELTYNSKDGEEGYPGNLHVRVQYILTSKNELVIEYHAQTDKRTIINLTNHSYFNLGGHNAGSILDHQLKIDGNAITPISSDLIPNGSIMTVNNTPFDFKDFHAIGERINMPNEQLKFGKGYDHNYVLHKIKSSNELSMAAEVYDPKSGRMIEAWTTQPGMQFYSGNFLDGTNIGKGKHKYDYRTGFCLEMQHYPDSPNHPGFPSVILDKGDDYSQKTIYKFMVKE